MDIELPGRWDLVLPARRPAERMPDLFLPAIFVDVAFDVGDDRIGPS